MPLYEYECDACGHRFERIQKFSDPPVETCPKCGSPVRKLMSSPAIQFKGTGWYITDYAKKDSASTKADEKPEAKAGGKTEPKSESAEGAKPAETKSETKAAPAKDTKSA